MSKPIDMTNQVFNSWTVIEKSPIKNRQTYWVCKCECGTKRDVQGKHLRSGASKCCGCKGNEKLGKRSLGNTYSLIHGLRDHPLRAIRKAMLDRCNNKNNLFHKNYGNRGIKVCDEWSKSLISFVVWAFESGWKKGLSIDRINNDGNYEPSNCQWITISENSKKKKSMIAIKNQS